MILNKEQARAVYDAMCALNNVNGKLTTKINNIYITEYNNHPSMNNNIEIFNFEGDSEQYESQAMFHLAYFD